MNRPSSLTVGFAFAAALLIVPATLLAQGDPAPRGGGGPGGGGGGGGSNPGSSSGGAVSRGDVGGGGSSAGSWGGGSSGGGSSSGGGGFTSWGGGDASRRSGQAVSRGSNRPDGSGGTEGRRYGNSGDNESRVLPWYTRSRGGRPAVGTAAGREEVGRPVPGGGGYYGGRPGDYGYGSGYGYYGNYGYYPGWYGNCRSMYGFGAFGVGSFFYDPSWWSYNGAYPGYGGCGGYGYSGYALNGGYDPWYSGSGYWGGSGGGGGYSRPSGDASIKLKVKPSNAQVFVDGYFAGEVDEFDGVFQRLPLASGLHKIEIRAPGYVPLVFDVSPEPYEVINYKGELKRQ